MVNKQRIIEKLKNTGWIVDENSIISSKHPCIIYCPSCNTKKQIRHPAGFLQRPPKVCSACYQLNRKGPNIKIDGKTYKGTDFVDCTCSDCHSLFKRKANRIVFPIRCKSCTTKHHNKNRVLSTEEIKNRLKNVDVKLIKILDDGYARIVCPQCKKEHDKLWKNVIASKNGIHKNTCVDCSFKNSSLTYTSKYEDQVNQIIKKCNMKTIKNKRGIISSDKRLEIDVYVPSIKIGFEVNGVHWHSSKFKDKNYHKRKTELAKKDGIQIIHLFEDELVNKPEVVKSLILSKIGKTKKIFARKCSIQKLSKSESKHFFNKNHIQGNARSKESFGLVFENRIVMAISIGRPRFNKNYDIEIIRICSEIGYSIIGGTSKLIAYIKKNNKDSSIISYADLRFGLGTSFEKSGMKLISYSPPNYWYVINGNRESRNKFMKHKLKDFLVNYDESKTETKNMEDNNYHRIYDCGNAVFVYL